MDYWALGHVHRAMEVLDRDGARYPGCPQGLSPRDVGPRGCLLVELSDGRPSATFVDTDAVRWTSASVDVSRAQDLDSVRDALHDASEAARAEAARPCILRVELVGRTPVRRELVQPGALEQLVDVVRAEQMTRDPWVWIDRVTDRTSSVLDLEELAASESFVGDVVDIARDWLSDPERARALVAEEAKEAADRFRLPGLEPDADAVVGEALDIVLDRLLPEDDSE
jgi:DNA repair exonuclease SbcCD nuclease subunit